MFPSIHPCRWDDGINICDITKENPDEPELSISDIESAMTKLKEESETKTKQKFKKDLSIEPIKTDRDKEWSTPAQKKGIVPASGLFFISGCTSSGKTVMICNLLGKKSMLKGYWKPENIYLFCLSPCPMLEDCVQMPKKNIINVDKPVLLSEIVDRQSQKIKQFGWEKAKRILIIIDDCAQSNTFLRSEVLTKLAFASTHFRISVWITSQSYTQLPRRVRINCHYLALFHGCRKSEIDRLLDEYESPYLTKNQMRDLIHYATAEKYQFLFINNTVPDKHDQFRKGFGSILKLTKK